MFKILIALGLLAFVSIDAKRGAEPNLKKQAQEVYAKAKESFPDDEWKAFWNKLVQQTGSSQDELKQKLKANNYNMDMTLVEVSDKLKDKATEYPLLNQQYNRIKATFTQQSGSLKGKSLQQVFNELKGFLESKFGPIDPNTLKEKLPDYLAAIFSGARRVRREIPAEYKPHVEKFKKEFGDKFPTNEWDTFWPKFQEFMASAGKDAKTELAKHNGNMDLTIEAAKDKAFDKYPMIQQHWQRVKGQIDQSIDKADETTVRELFNFIKTHSEQAIGRPINEQTLKEFTGNIQGYLTTVFSRMSQRYW